MAFVEGPVCRPLCDAATATSVGQKAFGANRATTTQRQRNQLNAAMSIDIGWLHWVLIMVLLFVLKESNPELGPQQKQPRGLNEECRVPFLFSWLFAFVLKWVVNEWGHRLSN